MRANMVVEIVKEKDANERDVFLVSRKHAGITSAGSGTYYSSWTMLENGLSDLNLPTGLLNGMKEQVDSRGFATVNLPDRAA
jgi:hypothetical protein